MINNGIHPSAKYYKTDMVYAVREVLTFRELLESSCEAWGERTAFLWRNAQISADGNSSDSQGIPGEEICQKTYAEVLADVKDFSAYLNMLGFEGKTIAVVGKNSYAWALSYLAVSCGCGVILPLDKDLRPEEINALLADSGAAALLYTGDYEEKAADCSTSCRKLTLDNLEEYLSAGHALRERGDLSYEHHIIHPHALGVLLYTSGTTGIAKGVMLSQYNICSDIVHVRRTVRVSPEDRVLSVLPLHHVYECTAGFLTILYSGGSIAYNTSLRKLQSDLSLFQPTIFLVVPLLLESISKNIMRQYAKAKGGKALYLSQKIAAGLLPSSAGKQKQKIFSPVSKFFGGNLRAILCGAAPLPQNLFREFENYGYAVYVGYGLTETSPVCIMHNDFYRNPEDTGMPLSGIEIRIADADTDGIGELAVRGSNIMLGYYKNPEETARVLKDGWFYTGDLARQTDSGAYRITGRIKSMIVAPNGKKIFPEELEFYLSKSPYIRECMVYEGEESGEHMITAAIFPDEDAVCEALQKSGLSPESPEYREQLRALFLGVIRTVNEQFPLYKHIRRLVVRKSEFEKTTTRKIRRNAPENQSEESAT